jgi:hypothetical protein
VNSWRARRLTAIVCSGTAESCRIGRGTESPADASADACTVHDLPVR